MPQHFTRATFAFFRDLERNNNREWFQANKERYEEAVKDPALRFISDFGQHLRKVSREFTADPRPVGGSLFRIHRDLRFARDKSPYKTNCAMQFRHRQAKDVHAPGFYLSLSNDGVHIGAGIYRPDGPTLRRIRNAIETEPESWRKVLENPRFQARFALGGESLRRAPRGYDPEHPLIEDLKRKDFYGWASQPQKTALGSDFVERYGEWCRAAAPLVRWLCAAVDVPF